MGGGGNQKICHRKQTVYKTVFTAAHVDVGDDAALGGAFAVR